MINSNKKIKTLLLIQFFLAIGFIIWIWQVRSQRIRRSKVNKSVLIVFSMKPEPCAQSFGEKINEQSFNNKRQYAQLKGFDVLYNRRYQDKSLSGTYTKIALLRELLRNESLLSESSPNRHEWFFWLDSDVIINDMTFDIPFERYENAHLVGWGDRRAMFRLHDAKMGFNSGVMLIRNSKWSLEFFEQIASFATRKYEDALKRFIYNYKWDYNEQNAIVYLLNHNPSYRKKVFFESSYSINGYWKHYFELRDYMPFIIHFAGCGYCYQSVIELECFYVWQLYHNKSMKSYKNEINRLKLTDLLA